LQQEKEKDARHRILHWPGFIIKETMFAPYLARQNFKNFNQNVGALTVKLTPDEMAELESYAAAGAVQGDRYPSMANT
jgi:aryl-alcohol dehydrogenase-like predicted oxidoreductase